MTLLEKSYKQKLSAERQKSANALKRLDEAERIAAKLRVEVRVSI